MGVFLFFKVICLSEEMDNISLNRFASWGFSIYCYFLVCIMGLAMLCYTISFRDFLDGSR